MFMRTWSVCRFLRMNNFGPVQRLRCYSQKTKKTHYEVLGVSEDATPAEIQEAFLDKSKKFHPDLNKEDPTSKDKFIEVSDAYSVLSKESSRNDYDDMLEEEEMRSQTAFQEHEYYGRYSENVEERVAAEREKWKKYYKSGKNQWQFEAENEQWQGRSQYENDGNIKSPFSKKQIQLMIVGLIALALAINFGGLYSTTQLRSKREAEKKISGPHICGDAIDIDQRNNHILTGSWCIGVTLQIWDFNTAQKIKDVPPEPLNNTMVYCCQWLGKESIICGGHCHNMARIIDRGTLNTTGQLLDLNQSVYCLDNDHHSNHPKVAIGSQNYIYIVRGEKKSS